MVLERTWLLRPTKYSTRLDQYMYRTFNTVLISRMITELQNEQSF